MPAYEDKILEAMKTAGKPVGPGQVADAMGHDNKDDSAAINHLKAADKTHSPKGYL